MRRVLAKLGFAQTLGVYCDGRCVYVSHLMSTPLGATELMRWVEPIAEEGEVAAVRQALGKVKPQCAGLRLVLAIPVEQSYFTTRPVSSSAGGASAKVLLRESLRCASASVDAMLADVVKSQPERRELASIAACPRARVAPLLDLFAERQLRLIRAEPVPCALLRLARGCNRNQRKSSVIVRVFLNETHALAVLTAGGRPIAWRSDRLKSGDEAASIIALVRSLVSAAEASGVVGDVSSVVAHGRVDLERLTDGEWLRQQLGVPVRWTETPGLDGDQIAYGSALGGMDEVTPTFDLAREVRRPPTLGQIFPWRDAALALVALLLLAGFLGQRALQRKHAWQASVRASCQSLAGSVSLNELESERKDLQSRLSAVGRFLARRVIWTAYLRELAARLPDSVQLTSLSGEAELEKSTKVKADAKRSLVIKAAVGLVQNGLLPQDVDRLLDTIRQHPVITADFPLVELVDVKQFRRVEDGRNFAMFTVMCLPKGKQKRGETSAQD